MIKSEDVFKKELKAISAKREKCNSKDGFTDSSNLFGISLSGGGIRSATINSGILKILNKCGVLPSGDFCFASNQAHLSGRPMATADTTDQTKGESDDKKISVGADDSRWSGDRIVCGSVRTTSRGVRLLRFLPELAALLL